MSCDYKLSRDPKLVSALFLATRLRNHHVPIAAGTQSLGGQAGHLHHCKMEAVHVDMAHKSKRLLIISRRL